ncbi:glutathione S-transferase [Aliidiomarina taiwanensis]|uniref:Glutathione S-transferase n=1 Tax=Aliidiomarina taiwanensis TaxID=946228 RepID=A0A432X7B6_9GAMM|nr:glutathione S-transferase family protein [Aliidiomarina taiwanensis]RUO42761.1 glutathione S-transferase [Aliidiomarina taiwanensis]
MKFYEMAAAPNPRRVRMFLAEKGLLGHLKRIEIDLKKGEHLTPDFAALNPMKRVPVLELQDGSTIAETMAICRYFEEQFPKTPKLLGETSFEVAHIEQWLRWLEFNFFLPVGMAFQHLTDYFAETKVQHTEWGEECKQNAEGFMGFLDKHLKDNTWICYDRFTAADITAFCTLEFARVVDIRIQPEHKHLQAWYDRMLKRDSANV